MTLEKLYDKFKQEIRQDIEKIIQSELTKLNISAFYKKQKNQIQLLKKKNVELKELISKQQKIFDQTRRTNNIIIFGLEEKKKETLENLESRVLDLCGDVLGVDLLNEVLNSVRRLGQDKGKEDEAPPPQQKSVTNLLKCFSVLSLQKTTRDGSPSDQIDSGKPTIMDNSPSSQDLSVQDGNLNTATGDRTPVFNYSSKETLDCKDCTKSKRCNLHKLLEENDFIGDEITLTGIEYESPSLISVDNLSIRQADVNNAGTAEYYEREIMIGDQPLNTFYNHRFVEEDRQWARFRVEMFSRELCIIYCVLGQMLLDEEEIKGNRDTVPTPEEARQILLLMTNGNHWDVLNLCMLLNLSDKINKITKFGNNFGIFKTLSREFMENSVRSCLDIWERDIQ